jgi:hypothetical protein
VRAIVHCLACRQAKPRSQTRNSPRPPHAVPSTPNPVELFNFDRALSRDLEWSILESMRIRLARKSAPRLVALLSAMLLTLGFAGVNDGIVLCLGVDGHVTIESVGPVGCAEVDETPDHPASVIATPVSSSHCGPCVDVALIMSSATQGGKGTERAPSPPLSAISIAELRPSVPRLRAAVAYQRTTRFASEKPHTVVIRC